MLKAFSAAAIGCVLLIVLIAAGTGAAAARLLGTTSTETETATPVTPTTITVSDIPADYLPLYIHAAATCPGLDWSVLAAVGKIETNHGRSTLPGVHSGSNSAGAQGPMQFLPATFAAYNQPAPPSGAVPPSPYDPVDAIYAAANLLCANGARDGRDLHGAIFNYNHAEWYVTEVLDQAHTYASALAAAETQGSALNSGN